MILIADDDSSVTVSLALALKHEGYRSRVAATPDEAMAQLERGGIELVLQDMNFSRKTTGEEGMALLKRIKRTYPRMPVILMTAWGSVPLAVEGIKAGAADFITKPWNNAQLVQSIRTTLGLASVGAAPAAAPKREDLDAAYDFQMLVGRDPALLRVLETVGRVAGTDASVLITGESGTGKELIAEAIHRNSRRRHQPFVKVNLGGISSTLFESEMFGHVRGAFTDAVSDRKGRFELADRGTIFLDEIGDLDPGSQVKLLRVLQDRTYEVLGSSTTRNVDVRVVSATNRPLDELVARGDFREDLLYRLNLITIRLPALRERQDDIPLLARHLLHQAGQAYGLYGRSLSEEALGWLRAQPWPGNVRQLRHTIERGLLVSNAPLIQAADFETGQVAPSGPKRTETALPEVGVMTLDEMERAMIEKALMHHGGNISRVAEALGLSRPALYRRFEKYGIRVPE